MNDLEFRALMEQRYREHVLYPEAARRQRTIEELRRVESKALPSRGPRRRLGGALVACGVTLAALGQRLQETECEPVAPSR